LLQFLNQSPIQSLRYRKRIQRVDEMNTNVEKYIKKQKSPQEEIVQKLRDMTLQTFPGVKEEFKIGVPLVRRKVLCCGA
jgi:hypothetical protein